MNIVYSFNKNGFEAEYWQREISKASDSQHTFVPFNHGLYLDPHLYIRAQLLDKLYYEKNASLFRMYADFENTMKSNRAAAVIVDNCNPYHPDYLKRISVYKALRTGDGPVSAYDRDFAYLHAFDHILYHSPAYSRDMEMIEKLKYCGAKRADLWPFGLFDAMHDSSMTEDTLLEGDRDIDVIFIGMSDPNKMPVFAEIQKALGSRLMMIGFPLKYTVYYNLKYNFPGRTRRPIRSCEKYVSFYQRAKIGINVHNRGKYTVGNYRMFDLPGNGVMQISDGDEYLDTFFKTGEEIIGYSDVTDLVHKVNHYLSNDEERKRIALNAFRRVKESYRIGHLLRKAGTLLEKGMKDSDLK